MEVPRDCVVRIVPYKPQTLNTERSYGSWGILTLISQIEFVLKAFIVELQIGDAWMKHQAE
jgi:hypothetical protein